MPFLFRTREQDIANLDAKPLSSLMEIHKVLSGSTKDVLRMLKKLEKSYYGTSRTPYEEIRIWSKSYNEVMERCDIPEINSVPEIEDILRRSTDPQWKFKVDLFDINRIRENLNKLREFLPTKFKDIIELIQKIKVYLEKYCLSFYSEDSGCYIETASEYEKSRIRLKEAMAKDIQSLTNLPEKFTKGKIYADDFSFATKEIARKGECANCMFLCIFTEHCETVRRICAGIESWILTDGNYASYIQNDIETLEKQRCGLIKAVRDLQHRFHQLNYRRSQLETVVSKSENETSQLKSKEDELMVEQEYLWNESNEIQIDIEIKEYRRDELARKSGELNPTVLHETYDMLSAELRELKKKLPVIRRQLAGVEYKLNWINGKREDLKKQTAAVTRIKNELDVIDAKRQTTEDEYNTLSDRLEKARLICLYKTSPDAIEKIFYKQPVEIGNARLPGNRNKTDPFERACTIVADNIEGDWMVLYRSLPFHPPRGSRNIASDIEDIAVIARENTQQSALRSLYRWRRFHTRSKLEDLTRTLKRIKRSDILDLVDEELNPPEQEEEEDDLSKYHFVPPELIPFVKEVERFDELRASNKL